MENQNNYTRKKENITPVARKSNEEIDEDDAGHLIVGGETLAGIPDETNKIVPTYETDSLGKRDNSFEGIED